MLKKMSTIWRLALLIGGLEGIAYFCWRWSFLAFSWMGCFYLVPSALIVLLHGVVLYLYRYEGEDDCHTRLAVDEVLRLEYQAWYRATFALRLATVFIAAAGPVLTAIFGLDTLLFLSEGEGLGLMVIVPASCGYFAVLLHLMCKPFIDKKYLPVYLRPLSDLYLVGPQPEVMEGELFVTTVPCEYQKAIDHLFSPCTTEAGLSNRLLGSEPLIRI